MSFLDRFKQKDRDEAAPKKAARSGSEPAPTTGAEPSASRPAAAAAAKAPEFKFPARKAKDTPPAPLPALPPAPVSHGKHEIILELSDFLPRIPKEFLHDGPHALETRLSFDVAELADRIARGLTTIHLTEIHRRAPEIFREEILSSDDTEIRFPWKKVMKMLADARTQPVSEGLSADAAAALAAKVRDRRAVRNILPGQAEAGGPAAPAPAPAPAANPARPAPVIPDMRIVATDGAIALSANTGGTTLNSPIQDDDKLSREELLRSREAMRAQLARSRGEFERQLAVSAQEKKHIAEERERLVAEMVRFKAQADDKVEQIAFEKSVASKSAENLAKA